MKIKETGEKIKSFIGKANKKTLIAVCSVLVLGCVVALSFILTDKSGIVPKKLAVDLTKNGTEPVAGDSVADYFASVSLQRKQARDEAVEVLKTVSENEGAVEEAKQAALDDINKIALDIEREANIESLVVSKGFSQCVAVISDNTCSIIVESDGLLQSEIAQISEIVYEQAGIVPANLKIIEKSKA